MVYDAYITYQHNVFSMKGIFALLVLVILAGGGWYFYQNSSPTVPAIPVIETGTNTDTGETSTGMETGTIPATETAPASAPATKVFSLTGKMFAFSQAEIRVKKGDTVTINFESTAGLHDWVVDTFNARTQQVQPGTKTSVTFVADKTGTFEYYCSVGSHRANGMAGKLIVE